MRPQLPLALLLLLLLTLQLRQAIAFPRRIQISADSLLL
jgi:hypothetical protein